VEQFKKAQWVRYKLNKNRLAELMSVFSELYGIISFQKRKRGGQQKVKK
ncbi:unnamed protein product, partial [marine sediment metagenome]